VVHRGRMAFARTYGEAREPSVKPSLHKGVAKKPNLAKKSERNWLVGRHAAVKAAAAGVTPDMAGLKRKLERDGELHAGVKKELKFQKKNKPRRSWRLWRMGIFSTPK
jgi:hypothetical protein